MEVYLGMDVHCKKSVYVAQDDSGKVIQQGVVPTTLEGFAKMLAAVPALPRTGLETGTQAMWVAAALSSLGARPVIIDAREVRIKARRAKQKSDFRDAFEICDGLRRGMYTSIVYVPDPAIQRLRRVLSRRRHFLRIRTSQVNASKYLLRSVGLSEEADSLTTEGAWRKLIDRPPVADLRAHLSLHRDLWRVAHAGLLACDAELSQAVQPFRDIAQLLQTAPGVGPLTSAGFIAVLATPERFPDSSHVASYIGLVPSTYDSGDAVRHGHITKRGASHLRMLLSEAAQHAADTRHPLNPYFSRIAARQGYKKAVVAVAHRLARILFEMWRKKQPFDPRELNVVPEKHVRARTLYWRIRKPEEELVRS
ncbi:MAG: IS110 family transposase [Planctomycetota bacterium]